MFLRYIELIHLRRLGFRVSQLNFLQFLNFDLTVRHVVSHSCVGSSNLRGLNLMLIDVSNGSFKAYLGHIFGMVVPIIPVSTLLIRATIGVVLVVLTNI